MALIASHDDDLDDGKVHCKKGKEKKKWE